MPPAPRTGHACAHTIAGCSAWHSFSLAWVDRRRHGVARRASLVYRRARWRPTADVDVRASTARRSSPRGRPSVTRAVAPAGPTPSHLLITSCRHPISSHLVSSHRISRPPPPPPPPIRPSERSSHTSGNAAPGPPSCMQCQCTALSCFTFPSTSLPPVSTSHPALPPSLPLPTFFSILPGLLLFWSSSSRLLVRPDGQSRRPGWSKWGRSRRRRRQRRCTTRGAPGAPWTGRRRPSPASRTRSCSSSPPPPSPPVSYVHSIHVLLLLLSLHADRCSSSALLLLLLVFLYRSIHSNCRHCQTRPCRRPRKDDRQTDMVLFYCLLHTLSCSIWVFYTRTYSSSYMWQ